MKKLFWSGAIVLALFTLVLVAGGFAAKFQAAMNKAWRSPNYDYDISLFK